MVRHSHISTHLISDDPFQATQTTKQRLALAIIDFLSTSLTDGTLTSEDSESIEIAQNCIAECFKVDPSDTSSKAGVTGSQNLLQIYTVYETLKNKTAAASASAKAAPATKAAEPTDVQKQEAEELKKKGNSAMATRDYATAIDLYSKALALVPGNPIFLSNRAAAYSASKDHESAKADAEAAVASDPKYTKAWSRLGLARFALGDARGAMEAYKLGIEHEGNGGSDAMKKGYETAKKRVEELEGAEEEDDDDVQSRGAGAAGGMGGMPDLSSLAGMFGGGAGGGGGGMPDLSSIMSNPMFASMAQNLMSNPEMMNNLMSNPRIRDMASQFGGGGGGAGGAGGAGAGGGGPDLASLMSDPSIAEM
jgi:small glutamine-rich tetratricopeptide repeat-containing protein alpha